VLEDIYKGSSAIIDGATIVKEGMLTDKYAYLEDYALGKS
jgi:hypothetical protein